MKIKNERSNRDHSEPKLKLQESLIRGDRRLVRFQSLISVSTGRLEIGNDDTPKVKASGIAKITLSDELERRDAYAYTSCFSVSS